MSEESDTSVVILGRKAGFIVSVNDLVGLSMRNGDTVHYAWSSEIHLPEATAMRKRVFNIKSFSIV